MSIKRAVLSAAAVLLAVPSFAGASFEASAVSAAQMIKASEGFSGVGSAKRADLTPADSWSRISERAWIGFPGVRMPDGNVYSADMLCADGDSLRVAHRRFGSKCELESVESGRCMIESKVELKTSRDQKQVRCAHAVSVNRGTHSADGEFWVNECRRWTVETSRFELTQKVPVYSKSVETGDGKVLIPSVLLFAKDYTVAACR